MYDQYPRTAEEIHLVYRGFDFQFSYYRRCQMMRPSICPHVVSAWNISATINFLTCKRQTKLVSKGLEPHCPPTTEDPIQ
ncbi:hypothetical protein Pmani_026486 [Petrolisthes manimaculis]|uniref:Uncharacterized protein n=1 Tax=Petrolisthes manimaculis TaxID=1843537 RepID=A0AAE1TZV2_9EUCA|nr:hypothetical protein Pmani_026712 [Petrolisthes manimaculis]KAK4301366.1 hypothetical protein Pmani_026486 [Petrolisthes manimaculis]